MNSTITENKSLVFDLRLVSTVNMDAFYRLYSDGSEAVNLWQYGDTAEGRDISLEEAQGYFFTTTIDEARAQYKEKCEWERVIDAVVAKHEATLPVCSTAGLSLEEWEAYVDEVLAA
jgi:hypothetical protein